MTDIQLGQNTVLVVRHENTKITITVRNGTVTSINIQSEGGTANNSTPPPEEENNANESVDVVFNSTRDDTLPGDNPL